MAVVDRLRALLPPETAKRIEAAGNQLTEIRLRSGRPIQLCFGDGNSELTGDVIDPSALRNLMSTLMEYSVYARQDELDQGFFTLEDGSRVGVCGRMYREGDTVRMAEIGSACIRISREIPGSADGIMGFIAPKRIPRSTLLLSPPGLGKTTLLRDIARQLSHRGLCVAIADERRELAACRHGVPTLDVGDRTDVMDGCPRAEAIERLVRSMAPRVVIADEIGGERDAQALADAARCGVTVVASAHADGLEDALNRASLRVLLDTDVIRRCVLLGPSPGAVREKWRREGGEGEIAWRRA